jgi:hypothetical protein
LKQHFTFRPLFEFGFFNLPLPSMRGIAKAGSEVIGHARRLSYSSLPGLTRQSMLRCDSFSLTARVISLHLSIDHRVKPGGDEEETLVGISC